MLFKKSLAAIEQQITEYESDSGSSLLIKLLYKGGKVAVKSNYNMVIAQGNHPARPTKYNNLTGYVAGNNISLDMRHFQLRSLSQVERKYLNGAKANILAQNKNLIGKEHGSHWTSFMTEIEQKGIKKAAQDRFDNFKMPIEDCTYDPLPMDDAFNLFDRITRDL